MQARGRAAQLLLDFETTFGQTPSPAAARRMPFFNSSLKGTQALRDDDLIRGRRDAAPPSRGNLSVDGSIAVPVDKIGIGWWCTAMFGAPITSGVGPYTHVWTVGDTQPSLTLEVGFTDIAKYFLYNGCKISKAGLSFGGDADVRMNLDLMGAKETAGAASFDDTPTDIALERFSMFQLSMQEDGLDIAYLTGGDLNIEFDLDGDQYCIGANGIRGDIPEGLVKVSGTIRGLFKDLDLLNKAINGTETTLKWLWTSGAHSLEILLQEVLLERNAPGVEGPKGVLLELPFRAYYSDGAAGSIIQVTLINTQASYAIAA